MKIDDVRRTAYSMPLTSFVARMSGAISGILLRAERAVPHFAALMRATTTLYRTSTFLNCHGSLVSISSGNNPGRSVSGVQSV
jgi:uncharacterized protein YcsI (UPF0317 family)